MKNPEKNCLKTQTNKKSRINCLQAGKFNYSQKVITKCDGIITNCDSLAYYKVRSTVVTNCDSFFITKCDTVYYKLRQVLQSAMDLLQIATGITKCDDYYKLRQYRPVCSLRAVGSYPIRANWTHGLKLVQAWARISF